MPAPLKLPVMLIVLVVVPLNESVPAIAAVPLIFIVVAVVPKSKVPALTLKLPPTVLLSCKVLTPLPEIVKFL